MESMRNPHPAHTSPPSHSPVNASLGTISIVQQRPREDDEGFVGRHIGGVRLRRRSRSTRSLRKRPDQRQRCRSPPRRYLTAMGSPSVSASDSQELQRRATVGHAGVVWSMANESGCR